MEERWDGRGVIIKPRPAGTASKESSQATQDGDKEGVKIQFLSFEEIAAEHVKVKEEDVKKTD